jgi:hypothetical protein
MRVRIRDLRRGIAALLVFLHAGITLGAGAHAGPHLERDVAWLPADLHHHSYGWTVTSPEPPHSLDPCVACHLSRLIPRLPAPPAAPVVAGALAVAAPSHEVLFPSGPRPDALGPRAPPVS